MKLPLLALRIWSFECADGLDRFFQSPDIQAIPLVEIVISNRSSEMRRQRSCALGKAVMVEHWLLGTFVGWNRYLVCLTILPTTCLETLTFRCGI